MPMQHKSWAAAAEEPSAEVGGFSQRAVQPAGQQQEESSRAAAQPSKGDGRGIKIRPCPKESMNNVRICQEAAGARLTSEQLEHQVRPDGA